MKKENLQQQRDESSKLQIQSREYMYKRLRVPLEQKAGKTEAPSTSNVPSSEPVPLSSSKTAKTDAPSIEPTPLATEAPSLGPSAEPSIEPSTSYKYVGNGDCVDGSSNQFWTSLFYYDASGPFDSAKCAETCECAQIEDVTLQGFTVSDTHCMCLVDPISEQAVIDELKESCNTFQFYFTGPGTGEISGSDGCPATVTCYKYR